MITDIGLMARSVLVLLVLLFITRILGRRTLSELTFYDFVIGLVLGNIGGAIITDEQFGIRSGIIALMIPTLWVLLLNKLSLKSLAARKIIESEPLLVIHSGKILEDNLKKRYYNINDLLEMLREQGTFDPSQVEIALIEADGHLSVLKKPDYQSPTMKDFNIQPQTQTHAVAGTEIIIDGKIINQNLVQSGLSLEQLNDQLHKMGIMNTSDVMLAMMTPAGKLYVDLQNDRTNSPAN